MKSIAAARTEGGMVVKQWMSKELQFVGNLWKPKPKKKRWWQIWR